MLDAQYVIFHLAVPINDINRQVLKSTINHSGRYRGNNICQKSLLCGRSNYFIFTANVLLSSIESKAFLSASA